MGSPARVQVLAAARRFRGIGRIATAALLTGLCGCDRTGGAMPLDPLERLTGGRTRVAWCRQVVGDGTDAMGRGAGFVLMGLDTGDGRGERIILDAVSSYRKPLFDPAGERIVFSNREDHRIGVVDWDGSGLDMLRDGMALEVWGDPETGATWVYYVLEVKDNITADGHPVRRFRLDEPDVDEPVWNKTWVSADSFQVSADGRIAAGQFPWKDAGIAEVPNGSLRITGQGCWTGLAPDNSYTLWIFDGAHKNLLVKPFGSGPGHKIKLNTAPGTEGHEVYHPRWSNHPRILAMSGPYRIQGQHNAILGGGKGINIYVGRFARGMDDIESWAQVTRHDKADFFPDVWVEGGGLASADAQAAPPALLAAPPASWPVSHDGLVFVWEHAKATNRIRGGGGADETECTVVRHAWARLNRTFEADLDGGWVEPLASDSAMAAALEGDGPWSIELVATPVGQSDHEIGVVMQVAAARGVEDVAMVQTGMHLGLRLPSANVVSSYRVDAGAPLHVVLVFDAGLWTVYWNGTRTGSIPDAGRTERDRSGASLRFGRNAAGGEDWGGAVGGIAVYGRALRLDEIAAHARYALERASGRAPAPRLVFRGELVETTPSPTPEAIAPYRDGLVEYVYAVDEVLEGECNEERIIVQHWAILDAAAVPIDVEVGRTYTVQVEPVDAHPELEGERVSSTVEDPLLDVYIDVAPISSRESETGSE